MKRFSLTTLASLFVWTVLAVPVKKYWRTVTQSDGTQLKLMLIGDESLHYYVTEDDVPVIQQGNSYYYASVVGFAVSSTGVLAHDLKERTAYESHYIANPETLESTRAYTGRYQSGKQLRYHSMAQRQLANTGKRKGLVILANFADKSFVRKEAAKEQYDSIMNMIGYDKNGAHGSVRDYFLAQSNNQFDLSFDVVGPVTLSKNYAYYGGNDPQGNDSNAVAMIVEACCLADPQVNFADYDWDDDKEVEQVYVLYAGYGENAGSGSLAIARTVWPHKYAISGDGQSLELDGVTVDTYACSNELSGTSGTTIMGIGTVCHEFTHCLGLPDMYDTRRSGNSGTGDWDLMCSGSYNDAHNTGWCPAGYTAYEKNYCGWLDYVELSTSEKTVTDMKPLSENGDAYVLYNDAYKDEYYILENRARTGWDEYLPGEGLLIYHVDYDKDLWKYNVVNSTGTFRFGYFRVIRNDHERMALVPAKTDTITYGSGYYKRTRYKYTYPYPATNNDKLTDSSTPKASLHHTNTDGTKLLHKPVTDIKRNDDTGYISFAFKPMTNTSVKSIEAKEKTIYDVYDINGTLVAKGVHDTLNLQTGIYILHGSNGEKKKVVVR